MDKARVRVAAVEKVSCMLRPGNNRIRVNGVLIPYRAFDPFFESMLLARLPRNCFSTASVKLRGLRAEGVSGTMIENHFFKFCPQRATKPCFFLPPHPNGIRSSGRRQGRFHET